MSDITRTMHNTTIVEGYLDDPDAEQHIERARIYNRAFPQNQATITFYNQGFNLGTWESGNDDYTEGHEKYRIVYPQIRYFDD